MKTVAIIGAGRIGSAVGFLLQRAGYAVTAVVARTREAASRAASFIGGGTPSLDVAQAAAGADLVFITTPDRSIEDVCGKIAAGGGFKAGAVVVHTSGAHSLHLLDAALKAGAYRAVLHPLQSLADREEGVRNLPGSYFRVEADPEARKTARDVVAALGGIELALPQWSPDKDSVALYHAGAVVLSNYFVALVDYGLRFYQTLGVERTEALRAVLPLITGTLRNIERLGVPGALTGPIERGDVRTVRDHREALERRAPELLGLYRELAQQTIAAAREKGSITQDTAEELLNQLR